MDSVLRNNFIILVITNASHVFNHVKYVSIGLMNVMFALLTIILMGNNVDIVE